MTDIRIPLLRGRIARYTFGYSATDDIKTVSNWQEGDNTFEDVPDGTWYAFAKPKSGSTSKFLRQKVLVNQAPESCTISIVGFNDITPACQIVLSGFQDLTSDETPPVFTFNFINGINT